LDSIPYQQEIKRERSEHLISPDMVTKESFSAKRGRRAAAGFCVSRIIIPQFLSHKKIVHEWYPVMHEWNYTIMTQESASGQSLFPFTG